MSQGKGFDLAVKSGDFKQDTSGHITIRNEAQDGDFYFYVNDGGTDTLAVTIDGATAEVTLAKELNLSAGLAVTGAVAITGATTLTGAVTLDGTVAHALDLSGGTFASGAIKFADGEGAVVSANGMTADPEADAEAGYVEITIGSTAYQIPIYAA